MAKKKKERIVLENVELQPQVLGYTYQKKNNVGRVLIIFIAFILVVYFIDDISVFFNNLLGRETAETISNNASDKIECNVSNLLVEEYSKLDTEKSTTETATMYESDPNPATNIHIYSKDEEGNLEKFLLVYDKYDFTKAC